MLTTVVTNTLSALTMVAQASVVVGIVALLLPMGNPLVRFGMRWGLWIAFSAALLATAGSLYYSEIAHFEPCKLCWEQRIFMYPQVIVLGLALLRKNRDYFWLSIILSVVGGFISTAHYLLQRTGISIVPCSAVGYSSACAKNFVLQFGYITIPFMALSAFGLIIVSLLLDRRRGQLMAPLI